MADKYINSTGLQAIKTWIEGKFATIANLDTLEDRVDEIVAEGGEPNVINIVKVNGTQLIPDANKAVDVTVPTDSDIAIKAGAVISTSIGSSDPDSIASKEYVDENGGKIDTILVNGYEQTIDNKTVDLYLPTMTVGSTVNTFTQGKTGESNHRVIDFTKTANGNLVYDTWIRGTKAYEIELISKANAEATFQTEAQVQALIDAELEDITGIDFQVVQTLPATGEHGVIYLVHKEGEAGDIYDEYIWVTPTSGTAHYEQIGTTAVDLSGYWAIEDLQAMTVAEVNAILNA